MAALLEHIHQNRDFVSRTIHSVDPDYAQRFLRKHTDRLIMGVVTEASEGHNISADDQAFIARFYASGFVGTVADWIYDGMRECTGAEVCEEWLYHIGIPEDRTVSLSQEHANTTTCYMPYITAFFIPRDDTDRPKVVPEGAVNFAFIGQFAEVARDTIFTTEYSMRTGMEAVYTLCNVDRGVPEVWGSVYDVRCLLDATTKLQDGRKVTDTKLPLIERKALETALRKVKSTDIEKLLKEYGVI